MGIYRSLVKPVAFRFDPEKVHHLAMAGLKTGLVNVKPVVDQRLCQTLMGCLFANPIGLAAGFDKNGEAVLHWHRLGFGFAEIGTVTYHAQPGNPKPRLFRLPEEEALINRMGFNNTGGYEVSQRLKNLVPIIPLGVNIGKSKITEPEDAPQEYGDLTEMFEGIGDYLVINVSSPNTPGLRLLQAPEEVRKIVNAVREKGPKRRVLVKVAPDLADEELDALTDLAVEMGLTGMIVTNTTIARGMLRNDPQQTGGLSGAPLKEMANSCLARVARRAQNRLVIIGSGGVMSGDDAYEKIGLGAHLVQVYTGWIYEGPGFVPGILRRILERMYSDHAKSLDDVRGRLL